MKHVKKPKGILKNIVSPLQDFLASQELGGLLLLCATIIALILANSPLKEPLAHLWHTPIALGIANWSTKVDLHFIINDVLMTLFFVVVGLEIKRELLSGALSSFQKAILPAIAAMGGMAFPAMIYALFNFGEPTQSGWGIPTATDIAFSLMVMGLLGKRVPLSLKIFLAALAIVDDLGAIVVIALFYTSDMSTHFLLYAAGVTTILAAMNASGVRDLRLYGILGAVLWYFVLQAGIHPTIAGVILAFTIPFKMYDYKAHCDTTTLEIQQLASDLQSEEVDKDRLLREQIIQKLQTLSAQIESPLANLIHFLHPLSSYVIMPLFALSNAGVSIDPDSFAHLGDHESLGIMLGLTMGKSIGITLLCFIAVKIGLGKLPEGTTWAHMYGMGWMAGIGFTMSMFVSGLAFTNLEYVETSKLSIILGSFISGLVGYVLLSWIYKSGIRDYNFVQPSYPTS